MSFFNKKIFLIFLILKISYQNFNLNKFSLNSNMKSKLTNKEKEKYENFLTQEKSFKQSLNFLSINFEPELKNYWNSLNKLILKFFIVSIFPLSFIIFYLILRFILINVKNQIKFPDFIEISHGFFYYFQ